MPQNRRFAWLSNSIIKKKKRNSPHSTNAPTFTKSYKITNYYFNNYAELILLKNLNSNEEFLQTRLFPTNANNSQVNNCSNLNLRERIGPHLVGCQNHKIRGLVFLSCLTVYLQAWLLVHFLPLHDSTSQRKSQEMLHFNF